MLEFVRTYGKNINIYKAKGKYFAKRDSDVTDLYINPQNLIADIREGFVLWRSIAA